MGDNTTTLALIFILVVVGVVVALAVVSIAPSKTVRVYSSLNETISGLGITLGINLAHSNVWSSTQTFQTILPSVAANYNLGSLSLTWNNAYFTNMIELLNSPGDTQPMLAWTSLSAHLPCIEFGPGGSTSVESGLCRDHTGTLDFLMNGVSTDVFQLTTTGIGNTQGFQSFSGSIGNGNTNVVVTLPVAEPDASYFVVCTSSTNGNYLTVQRTSATQITVNTQITGPTNFFCIVTHQ